MSLQLRRGAGAPSTTLAAGEPYFDTTNNDLYVGDGAVNRAYNVGVAGVKVYRALLTQYSTNDPVVTVLENTLGGVPVWTRDGAGEYTCTATGLFTVNKTLVNLKLYGDTAATQKRLEVAGLDANVFNFFQMDYTAGENFTDTIAAPTWVEIIVYP